MPVPKDDDVRSTFTYDHKNTPYSFSLIELTLAANAHFNRKCVLRQLSEGGYHKVNVPVLVCHIQCTNHLPHRYMTYWSVKQMALRQVVALML